jgi:serine/threonine-protein kinase
VPHQLSSHQVLFAATAIKLGFATLAEVTLATKASLSEPSPSLADSLENQGIITARQRKIITEQVERELSECLNAAETMVALSQRRLVNRQLAKTEEDSEEWATFDTIERYTSMNLHARGGQALIFKAYDQRIGREVAIKEFVPDDESQTSTPTVRFLREARVTGQLEHPNIVPVHELDRRPDGTLYYIMRFVRGKTLAQRLMECRTIADRMKYLGAFWDACNAIAFAHNNEVVHRDIKPQNVMVGEFGETVVVDWGIAKVRGKSDLRAGDLLDDQRLLHLAPDGKTAVGTAIGTPSYMSPEQAGGDIDEIDERSDVWGLGAMLYEILTGRPPYDGLDNTEILVKVIEAKSAHS